MSKLKRIIGVLIVFIVLQLSIVILQSHAADEDIFNGVDISENGDGSVIAKLSEDQTTLTIIGTGEMASYGGSKVVPWIDFKTRITTVIIKKGVTNIGMDAFSGCSTLANISIPDSVTTIDQGPFSDCDSLVKINIPSSVTYIRENAFNFCKNLKIINVSTDNTEYMSEDGILFNKQKTKLIRYPEGKRGEKYIIPSTITRINGCAFMNCYLKDLSITNNITSIGEHSFSGCKSIMLISDEEEIMPDILKKALDKNDILYTTREFEFKNCTMNSNADKIIIDKSTENAISVKVKDGILYNFTVVFVKKEMDISANHDKSVIVTFSDDFSTLTIAGNGKMKDWHSNIYLDQNNRTYNRPWDDIKEIVTKIKIQQGVTNIGTYAFYYCSGLKSIEIPNSVTSIGYCAFWVCSSLIEISIPSEITRIEEGTFAHCSSLTTINIPEKVTVIDTEAFSSCSNLKNIILPSGVTRIGELAFIGCSSLEFIEIPSSVTSIGERAFGGCSGLRSIEIPNSVTSIGSNAFNNCSNLMSINVESNNTKYISIDGILFNKEKTEIIMYPVGNEKNKYTIPNTVTKIGGGAFSGGKNLTNIEIPNSVIKIGDSAFSNCSNLTKVEIPGSVIDMGDYIFMDCINLTSINIPNGVTRVGSHAFCRCSSLTSIEIPSSVTSIGWNAFRECNNLTILEIPVSVTKIDSGAFIGCRTIVAVATGTDEQEIMPNILARALDENDILHTTKAFTLKNCEMNESGDKIKVNVDTASKNEVSIIINDGALSGLTVVVVPSGTITYNTTDITYNEVISTLHIAEGEKITNNEGKNTHTFTENGEFTYTYTTVKGEEKTATATVSDIIKLESAIYNIDKNLKTISNIQPQTTAEALKNGITTTATNIKILDSENKEVDSNATIETGMKVNINGIASFTLIVTGDTNGDGQANIKDILQINKHRLNKAKLANEYLTAGDVNQDGKVDIRDILQINKYRLGKISNL